MSNHHSKINFQQSLIVMAGLGIVMMISGFLFNRVVSNIGFVLIGIFAISKLKSIQWLFRDSWMISFMALVALPIISDIYMEGSLFYHHRGVMKLLLILFPSFVFALNAGRHMIRYVHYLILCAVLISTCYSLHDYFIHIDSIFYTYKISQVMDTLSLGDHIRISWMTVISIVIALYELLRSDAKYQKWMLMLFILVQVVFLHLLGSKTGLISLYLTALILSYYLIPRPKKWLLPIAVLGVLSLPVIAYKTIPSLEQRFNFIKYDFEHYSQGEYREGLSDAVRFYSLLAAKDIITDHPWTGVGFSKLQESTESWYQKNIPEMGKENYFLPSSQWVIYWASAGILGFLVFTFHIIYPFFRKYLRKDPWFMAFFIPAIVSFTYETHLEGQLPLFVYGFFVSWFWYLAYSYHQSNDESIN
ncbi:MAG: O-antigen ligase family protein [Saprospiraceae bacterium]